MRNTDELLIRAEQIAQALTSFKRTNTAHSQLTTLRQNPNRSSLAMQLLDVSEHQLDQAIDNAESLSHSELMIMSELVS